MEDLFVSTEPTNSFDFFDGFEPLPESEFAPKPKAEPIVNTCTLSYPWKSLASYGKNHEFSRMVEEYKNKKRYNIGFSFMGDQGELRPCFLILGAEASVGKTTLLTQIADQISESGNKVLLFSLEQSEFDIFSKGLSRTIALKNGDEEDGFSKSPSAKMLQEGKAVVTPEIHDAYTDRVKNVFVVDNLNNSKVGNVVEIIDQFCETHSNEDPPVVIIDYFQILSTNTGGEKTKASFDAILATLKACQKEHNLLMMVISSVNRAQYGKPITLASFKETGNLEYTADIIWGLHFGVVDSDRYQKSKSDAERAKMLSEARAESPRSIMLTVLKNRSGDLPTFCLNYYPHCDLFLEGPNKESDEAQRNTSLSADNQADNDEVLPE